MKYRFTSRFGRGRTRTTTSSRVSSVMLQPCEQPVQIDAVLSSSQARALCRKSFESSDPTGQPRLRMNADEGAVAALRHVQHRFLGDVLREADAARAENAAVGHVQHVGPEVLDRVEPLGELAVARAGPAFLEHEVLQLALAGLIADRAVERMIDEQELEHALARVLRRRRLRFDDHALGDGRRAGDRELRRLLDLNQTHAAHAGDRQPRVIAVVRDQHAGLLRRLDDERAGWNGDRRAVDRQIDHAVSHQPTITG